MNPKTRHLRSNWLWLTGILLLLIAVNLIYASYFITDAYSSHNMVSNLVMARAPLHGTGLPYKDYWDIYPPGIFIFLTPFEFFFHGQTMVFKLFHILFAIIIGLIVLRFLLHLFRNSSRPAIPVTVFFSLYLLFSNYYYCILFHNAFLALFLSVCGLYALAFLKKTWTTYFFSTLLFAFSASMKETFLFTIFLPLLVIASTYLWTGHKNSLEFFKSLAWIAAGIVTVLLGNYFYLQALGVTESYSEVSSYKSNVMAGDSFADFFNKLNPLNFYDFSLRFGELSTAFFRHSYGLVYCLFIVLFFSFLVSIRLRKENGKWKAVWKTGDDDKRMVTIVFGFLILNFEGFQLLNKYQPNYTLQMVPALVLAFALLFRVSSKALQEFSIKKQLTLIQKKGINVVMLLCFTWLLFPKPDHTVFIKPMSLQEYTNGISLEKPVVILPAKVKQVMNNDPRIFFVYGWGTPYYYYFSNTKPFSRFFILHPSIMGDEQLRELVEQFKTELPKVVLYDETGADMNTVEFENNTIQFKKLLEKCYEFYPAETYPGFCCKGYYLLKSDVYFKQHPKEFIALKYL